MKPPLLLLFLILIKSSSALFGFDDIDFLSNFASDIKDGFSSILADAPENFRSLVKFTDFALRFLDSSIEEDCVFKCKSNQVAVPNPNHIASYNGCGSLGFNIPGDSLPDMEMETCCNVHDECYDRCGADKERCDKEFKRCLYASCERGKSFIDKKKCQATAKLLFSGTMVLGCTSYKNAQKEACLCVNRNSNGNYQRRREFSDEL